MKRLIHATTLLTAVMLSTGCGSSDESDAPGTSSGGTPSAPPPPAPSAPEQPGANGKLDPHAVNRELLALLDETATRLSAIRDEASARTVARQYVSIERRKKDVLAKLQQLKRTLGPAENQRLASQYGSDLTARGQRVAQESQRVQSMPQVWLTFQEELQAAMAEAPRTPSPPRPSQNRPPGSFLPNGQQSLGDFGQPMIQKFGASNVVRLSISGLPGDVGAFLQQRLSEIAKPQMYVAATGLTPETVRIAIAPVADLQAVASQIDFGTVTDVDTGQRIVTIRADASKLPEPLAKEVSDPDDPNFYRQNLIDLKSFDKRRAEKALDRLAKVEPVELREEIAAAIEPFLSDPEPRNRRRALPAMVVWTSEDPVKLLIDAMADEDTWMRRDVLELLAEQDDPRVYPAIAGMLVTDRHQAMSSLLKIGTPAQKAVAAYFTHEEVDVRRAALNVALKIAAEEIVPELIAVLSDSEKDLRHRALEILTRLNDPRAVVPVAGLLLTKDDRHRATSCLLKMGPVVEETVIKGLKYNDPEVVQACCQILEEVGTRKSLTELKRLTKSDNFFVSTSAESAMEQISDRGQ